MELEKVGEFEVNYLCLVFLQNFVIDNDSSYGIFVAQSDFTSFCFMDMDVD